MKRRRMLLAVIAGTPLLLVLLAITLAPLLVESEPFRARVIAEAKTHTGRDLHIDGEMSLRLFPRAVLHVTNVRLANPPDLTARTFAELAELELELNLIPLLAGRIEMRRLVAHGLTLNLERGEDGRGNWDGLMAVDNDAGSARGTAIGAMALREATITWRDPETGVVTPIADVDVEFTALQPGVRVEGLRVRAALTGRTSPGAAAVIDARGDVELDDTGAVLLMPKIDAIISDVTLAGARIEAILEARIAVDFPRQRLTLENLHVAAQAAAGEDTHASLILDAGLALDLAGQRLEPGAVSLAVPTFSASGLGGELQLGGVLAADLQTGDFALTKVKTRGSIGKTDDEHVPFGFDANVGLSAAGRVLTAQDVQMFVGQRRAAGSFEVRAADATAGTFDLVVDDQALSGSFRVNESGAGHELRLDVIANLDLSGERYALRGRNALTLSADIQRAAQTQGYRINDLVIDADLAHPADIASGGGRLAVALQADADLDLQNETLRSDNLRLALDEGRVAGSVEARGFDEPAVRFDLQADTIDADRLMPPLVGEKSKAQTAPVGAIIEAIRALDLNGEIRVDRMTLRGLELENVRVRAGEGATDG